MSKRPATSEITPKCVKRIEKTDIISKMVKTFVSTEAEVDKGSEEEIDYFDESESLHVVIISVSFLPVQMTKPS